MTERPYTPEEVLAAMNVWDRLQDLIDNQERTITLNRLEVITILSDYDDLMEK
jgi:hypothetical protein